MNNKMQLFENQPVRMAWDEEKEEWYFSIVDVVRVLTEQPDYDRARNYWRVLKNRLKKEGSQLVTSCNQLKLESPKDGNHDAFLDEADRNAEENPKRLSHEEVFGAVRDGFLTDELNGVLEEESGNARLEELEKKYEYGKSD